jgi:hypothetical protein
MDQFSIGAKSQGKNMKYDKETGRMYGTANDVGDWCDCHPSNLPKYIKRGIIPPRDNKLGYDIQTCVINYIRWKRKGQAGAGNKLTTIRLDDPAITGKTGEPERDLDAELKIEKIRAAKRLNDVGDGLLVPAEDVKTALIDVIHGIRPVLESIPGKIKMAQPDMTAAAYERIQTMIGKLSHDLTLTYKRLKTDD